jgi:hypothetical protein
VYIIDDGSAKPLVLPKVKPAKTKLIPYKNAPGQWGKTAATKERHRSSNEAERPGDEEERHRKEFPHDSGQ